MDERPGGPRSRPRRDRAGDRPSLRALFLRQLAADDDRAAFWVRQVWLGIVLTEVTALVVIGYVLAGDWSPRRTGTLVGLATLAVLATPLLGLLRLSDVVRDPRGPLLFYGWSAGVTAVVVAAVVVDGVTSPLVVLLFQTLGFMAMAFPPAGVLLMGGVMTAAYLASVSTAGLEPAGGLVGAVLACYTGVCALTSANQWEAHDRQVLLLRTSEVLAATDPLTGCLNRRAFLDRLDRAAADAGRDWVVCLVDLDGFKAVNDRTGHAAGDAVLRSVTAALSGVVRETDTVARLGGDEFAVLAETVVDDTEPLAARLRDAVARAGAACGVTASVGVTAVRHGDEGHEVLGRADQAMYRAKGAGGNRVTALAG